MPFIFTQDNQDKLMRNGNYSYAIYSCDDVWGPFNEIARLSNDVTRAEAMRLVGFLNRAEEDG